MPDYPTAKSRSDGSGNPQAANAGYSQSSRLPVIINTRSGGVMGRLGELPLGAAISASVATLFADAGVAVQVQLVSAEQLPQAIAAAVAEGVTRIVVGGGDGSIGTAAGLLAGTPVALGVLPLGTLNLLARDLGLPTDLPGLVRVIAAGHVREIDVAEVNGRVYLNNAVLGLYPTLVRLRERQRGVPGWRKWPSLALAILRVLRYHNAVRLEADLGGGPEMLSTAALAVVNNVVHDRLLGPHQRPTLTEGRLGVYIARRRSMVRLLALLARLILGWRRRDPEMAALVVTRLEVKSRKRRLKVSVDGEVVRLAPPLVFRVRPRALRVMALPPESDDNPDSEPGLLSPF